MENRIENYKLWQQYKRDKDQQARQELIIIYLPLVKYQASRVSLTVPDFIEREDLESYGIIGLIDAIEKFDYRRGIEFQTYAVIRIKGEIIDHLRELDWLPHSLRSEGKRMIEIADKMTSELGRRPTVEELGSELDISQEKIESLFYKLYSSNWVSLYDEFDGQRIIDNLLDKKSLKPESVYREKNAQLILAAAIDRLKEKERLVISLYYFEDLTQKEIAAVLELSPARVSQLHKKAIYRLRGFLSRKKEELEEGG